MKHAGVLSADAARWRAMLAGGRRWALGGALLGTLFGLFGLEVELEWPDGAREPGSRRIPQMRAPVGAPMPLALAV